MAKNQKPTSTDANPIANVPTVEALAEYVRYASIFAPHLSLDQRREVIMSLGNPEPVAAPASAKYESGKQYGFRLTYQDIEHELQAANEIDARAAFNDSMKKWPPPKAVECVCLGEATDAESPIADLPMADGLPAGPGLSLSNDPSNPTSGL